MSSIMSQCHMPKLKRLRNNQHMLHLAVKALTACKVAIFSVIIVEQTVHIQWHRHCDNK